MKHLKARFKTEFTARILNLPARLKIIITGIAMSILAAPGLFAAQTSNIAELESVAEKILGFFSSKPVQLFFAVALAAMGIGFIANRDNQEAKKKFLMWGIGIGVVLGAQTVTDMFFAGGAVIL